MSIEFNNLTFTYFEDSKPIISELSAAFEKEKITVLTGVSGCGKSTLLYLAAGLYPHNAGIIKGGSVTVEGVNPDALMPFERTKYTALMFQNPELQFCMDTAEHELEFCLENIKTPANEIPKAVDSALEFCDIANLKKRTLISLSGGERQKVMLACIFVLKPKWILLDEPFANIDNAAAKAIAQKLNSLHKKFGIGILAVDHRLDNWLSSADEIRFMKQGKLLDKVMDAKNLDARFLEESGIIVPNRPYLTEKKAKRPRGETVLKLENISVFRNKKEILSGINAEFDSGRIHAVVGESGCGKSTLFGAISGIYKKSGKIIAFGKELKGRSNNAKIGFVTQNPQDQFIGDTVLNEITQSMKNLAKDEAESRAKEILKEIKLLKYRDISPFMLSQGQQRRLGVAALIAFNCKILICDEPTYAQDRISTLAIMNELVSLVEKEKLLLIISTHDMQLAKDYADVLWKLEGGKLNALN